MGPGNGIKANAGTLAAGAALVGVPLPASATNGVHEFRVAINVAPGAGSTRKFDLLVNGAATVPAITCSITGAAATTCSDLVNTVTWVAGDRLSVGMTVTGAAAAAADGGWSLIFTP
jgi:hypothetical protein